MNHQLANELCNDETESYKIVSENEPIFGIRNYSLSCSTSEIGITDPLLHGAFVPSQDVFRNRTYLETIIIWRNLMEEHGVHIRPWTPSGFIVEINGTTSITNAEMDAKMLAETHLNKDWGPFSQAFEQQWNIRYPGTSFECNVIQRGKKSFTFQLRPQLRGYRRVVDAVLACQSAGEQVEKIWQKLQEMPREKDVVHLLTDLKEPFETIRSILQLRGA